MTAVLKISTVYREMNEEMNVAFCETEPIESLKFGWKLYRKKTHCYFANKHLKFK